MGTFKAYSDDSRDGTQKVTYSLANQGGNEINDNNLFYINKNTGEIRFKNAPDYENPKDWNYINRYRIHVITTGKSLDYGQPNIVRGDEFINVTVVKDKYFRV